MKIDFRNKGVKLLLVVIFALVVLVLTVVLGGGAIGLCGGSSGGSNGGSSGGGGCPACNSCCGGTPTPTYFYSTPTVTPTPSPTVSPVPTPDCKRFDACYDFAKYYYAEYAQLQSQCSSAYGYWTCNQYEIKCLTSQGTVDCDSLAMNALYNWCPEECGYQAHCNVDGFWCSAPV